MRISCISGGKSSLVIMSLVFIVGLFGFRTFAQANTSLEDSELLMGKLLKMTVDVPLPNDSARVSCPAIDAAGAQHKKYIGLLNDTIEILTDYTRSIDRVGDRYFMKYSLTVQAFDSGRYEIPSLDFLVNGDTVKSTPVALSVIPVKAKADDKIEDFSDVAEPFDVYPNPEELEREESAAALWWLIAAAIVLLIIILYIYFTYRKTGRLPLMPKPLPVHVQALNRLKKLSSQNLPQKGKTKEYYTRLTDILRFYLHRQFGIKTVERTSSEILSDVTADSRLQQFEGVLKSLFETSDFVKFAKVNPSEVENTKCMQEAVRFIEESYVDEKNEVKEGGKK